MPYAVKEMFYTLQGEGAQAGRAAVFCRFAGCNLWSGLEADRATAICQFCDTEFVGTDGINGGKFATADALVAELVRLWGEMEHPRFEPYVVFTGGEPLLQLDETLAMAAVSAGFEVAVETNGTRRVPRGVHWICVSPKAGAALSQIEGSELKLVYPQAGAEPGNFTDLDFEFFYLQPMDGPNLVENQRLVVDYCLKHPQWRVSLQTHKILAIP